MALFLKTFTVEIHLFVPPPNQPPSNRRHRRTPTPPPRVHHSAYNLATPISAAVNHRTATLRSAPTATLAGLSQSAHLAVSKILTSKATVAPDFRGKIHSWLMYGLSRVLFKNEFLKES
ncbi:unnamed protein product [Vicia faba]|uniref:Uncharacterized protein n=1 Tax=Vicia faba TaxID=3906 RepID=A0AAV1APY5_VICFA|nr:unnamed protein product [Vicia faba]